VTFVTLEGIEGCGKSTQAPRLGAALGPDVCVTQEPGGTALGRAIRELLLGHKHHGMAAEAELLLFFADRAQHVRAVIRPALAAGRTVVCDRYVDSSLAYQGYGRGLPLDLLGAVAQLATGGLRPDLTLWLDLPLELGLERAARRSGHDRLEAEARAFHERVHAGYVALARAEPQRWRRIDAVGSPDEVLARLVAAVRAHRLERHGVR
jgi:dTMP kinase